jgi:NAD(P)-dependent dehydrogenase (short-subunit alcohol dehydrogenase family)
VHPWAMYRRLVDLPSFDLDGAVAVVTGSTRGIGKQAAVELARGGATVVVVGRSRDAAPNPVLPGTLDSVVREIAALGADVHLVQADITDHASTQGIVDEVLGRFGRCDVLVNNAAYTSNGPLLDVPASRWQRAFHAQVVGPLQLVQGFSVGMLERGSGRIVSISSVAATSLAPGLALYSVTKQAMERWNAYVDLELGGRGVSSNVLRVDRLVKTEGWNYVRDTQGEEVATMGASVTDAMTPEQTAKQILWMIRQPSDWSGRVVSNSDIEALGGPPCTP